MELRNSGICDKLRDSVKRSHIHLLRAIILLASVAALAMLLLGRDIVMISLCVVVGALLLLLSKSWRMQ
jgi:hypothetical protein